MSSKGKVNAEDTVTLTVDKQGENELVSSEDESSEESTSGEIISNEELEGIDKETLKKVLEEKQLENEKVKKELQLQEQEEKKQKEKMETERKRKEKEEKRRRVTELLNKIRKIESETEQIEQKVNSRNNSPRNSPDNSPEKASTSRKNKKKREASKENIPHIEGKEIQISNLYDDSLPNPGTPEFVDLVTDALNKGLRLTQECEQDLKLNTEENSHDNADKLNNALTTSINNAVTKVNKLHVAEGRVTVDLLLNLLRQNKGTNAPQLNKSQVQSVQEPLNKSKAETENLMNTLTKLQELGVNAQDMTMNDSTVETKQRKKRAKKTRKDSSDESEASSETDSAKSITKRNGKKNIKSGKCANPDKVGLLKSVHYPHEKLNIQFVKERSFEKLSFHFLVAGEIELLLDQNNRMTLAEHNARLAIVKQLCYHREYLEIDDLRDAYDSVMKEIEQGQSDWGTHLADKIHQFCEFRSNLIMREKLQKQANGRVSTGNNNNEKTKDTELVYCGDFNKQSGCNFTDHHEGRFNSKPMLKWHICRRCYNDTKEKKFHSETDGSCPKRGN